MGRSVTCLGTFARKAALVAASWSVTLAARGEAPQASGGDDRKRACVNQHAQAQVLQKESKLLEARQALIACSQEECPVAVRSDCAVWLNQVTSGIPSLVIRATVGGVDTQEVRVLVDGELLRPVLDGRAIELNPGLHSLRCEAVGEKPQQQQVLLAQGERNRFVAVAFRPPQPAQPSVTTPMSATEPPRKTYRPIPVLDYVLGGLVVVSAGSFAGFGLWGLDQRKDLQNSCQPTCKESQIHPIRTKFLIADISLAVAAAALIATGYVYVTRPEVERPSQRGSSQSRSARWGAEPERAPLGWAGEF
jgi:hypothetical protein